MSQDAERGCAVLSEDSAERARARHCVGVSLLPVDSAVVLARRLSVSPPPRWARRSRRPRRSANGRMEHIDPAKRVLWFVATGQLRRPEGRNAEVWASSTRDEGRVRRRERRRQRGGHGKGGGEGTITMVKLLANPSKWRPDGLQIGFTYRPRSLSLVASWSRWNGRRWYKIT